MKKITVVIIILLMFLGIWVRLYNSEHLEYKDRVIKVYVCGEINKEGIYSLNEKSRLEDLIKLAGGLKEGADVSKINYAQKLIDGEKIVIKSKKREQSENKGVDIHSMSYEDWIAIDGIGDSTANNIIDYLEENRNANINDLINVPGIGDKKLKRIIDGFTK